MLRQLKEMLFSENGMKIVNMLFFIMVFLRSSVLTILTYGAWLVFLACSVKRTESKGIKAFYLLLAVYSVVVIVWNLWKLVERICFY